MQRFLTGFVKRVHPDKVQEQSLKLLNLLDVVINYQHYVYVLMWLSTGSSTPFTSSSWPTLGIMPIRVQCLLRSINLSNNIFVHLGTDIEHCGCRGCLDTSQIQTEVFNTPHNFGLPCDLYNWHLHWCIQFLLLCLEICDTWHSSCFWTVQRLFSPQNAVKLAAGLCTLQIH